MLRYEKKRSMSNMSFNETYFHECLNISVIDFDDSLFFFFCITNSNSNVFRSLVNDVFMLNFEVFEVLVLLP